MAVNARSISSGFGCADCQMPGQKLHSKLVARLQDAVPFSVGFHHYARLSLEGTTASCRPQTPGLNDPALSGLTFSVGPESSGHGPRKHQH